MASYDPARGQICVRIVYDGAAGVGKTTNLAQLAAAFAQPAPAAPFALRSRTLYFDWLELAAGAIEGYPLVCQVLTVPGQAALAARRRALLAGADGVVVVCEAEVPALEGYRVPVVVQANKRDRHRAPLAVPVVEAIATDGVGVVATFVAILGDVVRELRAQLEGGARLPVRCLDTLPETLGRVAAVPIDHEGAAELFLQEAFA